MPSDSAELRAELQACIPSIVIDGVAKESGQRVVYFSHFEDRQIPNELILDKDSLYLKGWETWGKVVVKVVSGAGTVALTRLQAEANLLAELQSPQFPRLLYSNYFTENPVTDEALPEGLYVSVEEFVESVPLSDKLHDYVAKPVEVFNIAKSVVCGLRPLWEHKRKLVHRDVKPDNLLLTSKQEIVIIDFGIVRETGAAGITQEGWGKAPISIDYAAPEHIANDKDLVSFKTDVFSLGVLMYQLISGTHPFRTRHGMDMMEIIEATEKNVPPSLFKLGFANQRQSDLVERMMEKKPYLRPRTVDLLIQELSHVEE
ncbi:serine/threonine-protein kinase [Rhodoferax saidenbachensis]|uniref:Serine/threonine protein kinase n=1 Tax=Rhodoferax saidenbachensis TaxID=1484693 RepID=A0ABU1ZQ19_9BURK|nr:serine/threonine-protein kinase [Rhodoferax saidenbachensis]MDR7307654.1 serine/threonine protein kinase [Rhodoferax saidenbachensis]